MKRLRKFFNEQGEYALERICKRTDSCLVHETRGVHKPEGVAALGSATEEECYKEFTIPLLVLGHLRRVCPFLYVYYSNRILISPLDGRTGEKGLGISIKEFYNQVIEISGGRYTNLDCALEFQLNFPRTKRDPSTSLFMEFTLTPRVTERSIFSDPHKDSSREVTFYILSELFEVLGSWVVLDIMR